MLTGHKGIVKALAWLGSGGDGVFHPPVLEGGSVILSLPQSPRPALAPGRLRVGRTEGGAERQLQTVRAKRQVYSRVYSAEGGGEDRTGTPHARVLSICLSPPSSPTLLFSPRPKQTQAPRPGGKAVLTLRKVREPGRLEAGSPEAGPEASIRGQCPAWSPFTPHRRSLALGQKN